jgi:hypothetical protein
VPVPKNADAPRDGRGVDDIATDHSIVGMTNCDPDRMPEGQREVTVLVLV